MTILGLVNERSEVVKEYKHTRRMVMIITRNSEDRDPNLSSEPVSV